MKRISVSLATFLIVTITLSSCGLIGKGDQTPTTEKEDQSKDRSSLSKLSSGKRMKFDNLFFDAIKEKQIGNKDRAIEHLHNCLAIYDKDPAIHYQLSKIFQDKGRMDTALAFAQKAVALDKSEYWYQYHLAEINEQKEKYAKAAKAYERAIELKPEIRQNYYKLANMHLRQKNLQEAVNAYDRFEEKFGMDSKVAIQKHRIYLEMNKVEKAADELRQLIDVHPSNLEYYKKLARVYMVNNKEEKALEVYEKMLEVKPGNGKAQMALAEYYTKNGKKEKGFDYLKKAFGNEQLAIDKKVKFLFSNYLSNGFKEQYKDEAFALGEILIKTHPKEAKAHAVYADFLYQANDYQKARKHYRQALNHKKDIFSVWENLLDIEYRHLQDYQALKAESQKAMTYFPNQPILYFYSGFAHLRKEAFEKAIEKFEVGINLTSGNEQLKMQFLTNLAEAHHQLGNHEKSDQYFEKALNKNPNNPLILNNYSYYLSLRGAKLEKAEKMSRKSLEMAPENSAYMDTYGWINYKQGDYEKAKEYIGKALEQNPKDPELLDHYGDVLFKMDQVDEAVKFWKKARENGGDQDKLNSKIQNKSIKD